DLSFKMSPKVIVGNHKNEGKIAVAYGPLVLGADAALLNGAVQNNEVPLRAVAAAGPTLNDLNVKPEAAPAYLRTWPGARVFSINAVTRMPLDSLHAGSTLTIRLIPFADAGETGTDYKVWIPLRGATVSENLLIEGREARSCQGNLDGSINDDDFH